MLERYRNTDGEYLVAIDAVHLFSRRGRYPGGMYKTIGGKLHTCYYVLEDKVVTVDGFAFSRASVFIENEETYDKQDCELKAFYRLTAILKQRFPRLRLCLLLDGLYANRHVLARCEKNGRGFAIVFKSGSIPSLYAEMLERMASPTGHGGMRFSTRTRRLSTSRLGVEPEIRRAPVSRAALPRNHTDLRPERSSSVRLAH